MRGGQAVIGSPPPAGCVLGVLTGWVLLTQPLQVTLLCCVACLYVVLRWDRLAASNVAAGIGIVFVLFGTHDLSLASLGWPLVGLGLVVAWGVFFVRNWRFPGTEDWRPFRGQKRIVAGVVLASVVVGLVGLPVRPNEFGLKTRQWPAVPAFGCGGVGLDAIVRGSPSDPRHVWLEDQLTTSTFGPLMNLVWPEGYRVRFTPKAEVLDGWGNVVLRDGDHVSGTCGGANDDGTLDMSPPFN